MKRVFYTLLMVALLTGSSFVWRKPGLVIHLDPALGRELDLLSVRRVFWRAGVWKLRFAGREGELGPRAVALELGRGRNPLLTPQMIAQGLTGPGHTEDRVAQVYLEDIDLFLVKHRHKFTEAGYYNQAAVRRRLITNTAVHEAWHAITLSHSHNVTDTDSVMFKDPATGALSYGTRELNFTRGHLGRLQEIFGM